MTTLLFLLCMYFTVLLAKYMRNYLLREQDKVVHKNKYDEDWDRVLSKRTWAGSFMPGLIAQNPLFVSLGLGLLSCIALISPFLVGKITTYVILISCAGVLLAIAGFIIGGIGAIQAEKESILIRYGGLVLSTLALTINFFTGPILLIVIQLIKYWQSTGPSC